MYAALDLSKYIISKCENDNCPISNMQLQKILYSIQKEFLHRDKVAFYDDIVARPFGPIVPDVYYRYCGYGGMPISNGCEGFLIKDNKDVIDAVIEKNRGTEPWVVMSEIKNTDGAWAKTYQNGKGNYETITLDLIKAKG